MRVDFFYTTSIGWSSVEFSFWCPFLKIIIIDAGLFMSEFTKKKYSFNNRRMLSTHSTVVGRLTISLYSSWINFSVITSSKSWKVCCFKWCRGCWSVDFNIQTNPNKALGFQWLDGIWKLKFFSTSAFW